MKRFNTFSDVLRQSNVKRSSWLFDLYKKLGKLKVIDSLLEISIRYLVSSFGVLNNTLPTYFSKRDIQIQQTSIECLKQHSRFIRCSTSEYGIESCINIYASANVYSEGYSENMCILRMRHRAFFSFPELIQIIESGLKSIAYNVNHYGGELLKSGKHFMLVNNVQKKNTIFSNMKQGKSVILPN